MVATFPMHNHKNAPLTKPEGGDFGDCIALALFTLNDATVIEIATEP